MQMEPIIDRLRERVPALRGVEGAARLIALTASNALSQQSGANAYVIPMAMRGGQVTAASGLFVQVTEQIVSVILSMRHADPSGARATAEIDDIRTAIIAAIAGWAPAGAMGAFRFMRADVVSLVAGTFLYQIEFAIPDQLRITP